MSSIFAAAKKYGPTIIGLIAFAVAAYYIWQKYQANQASNSAAAALNASSASVAYIQGQLSEANNLTSIVPPVAAINTVTSPQTLPDNASG